MDAEVSIWLKEKPICDTNAGTIETDSESKIWAKTDLFVSN